MAKDPALCRHSQIGKSARVDKVTVPELGLDQLVLRVRVFCRDCKEPFIMKTMADGFSTDEIGLVDGDLIVPLEYPLDEEDDEPSMERTTQGAIPVTNPRPTKDDLH